MKWVGYKERRGKWGLSLDPGYLRSNSTTRQWRTRATPGRARSTPSPPITARAIEVEIASQLGAGHRLVLEKDRCVRGVIDFGEEGNLTKMKPAASSNDPDSIKGEGGPRRLRSGAPREKRPKQTWSGGGIEA